MEDELGERSEPLQLGPLGVGGAAVSPHGKFLAFLP